VRKAAMPKEFIQEIRSYVRNDAIDIHGPFDKKEPKEKHLECSNVGNVTLMQFLKLFIQKVRLLGKGVSSAGGAKGSLYKCSHPNP
jgi:hypothetical protein